jgi:FHS family glucose/mannose:H+ symporter-like MFS transporter
MLTAFASTRIGLGGIALSGLTFAFLGAILPAWGYHLSSDYRAIGTLFLMLNLGFLAGVRTSRWLLTRLGLSGGLTMAAAIASFSYLGLIFTEAPSLAEYRYALLAALGFSSGLINPCVFNLLADSYRRTPAATLSLAGIAFVVGALIACLTVAGSIESYALWLPLAGFAGLYAAFFSWVRRAGVTGEPEQPQSVPKADLRNPAAILLTLILFFQFAGEWCIAAWLPMLLTQRLGISPLSALFLLALYWLALLAGRLIARALLDRVRHRRLLLGSLVAGLLGCAILGLTNSRGGATMAVLFTGSGFAMVFPLVAELIGGRFRYFHPIYFNGVFSLALTGGLLAPWAAGWLTSALGIQVAILIPFVTTLVVFVLLILVWIESRLTAMETT